MMGAQKQNIMKTLINRNKIRLAGGLLVLLMTAILAVATVKSYAQCWHAAVPVNGTGCEIPPSCCNSCCGYILWCCGGADITCASGPDNNGWGFAKCQEMSSSGPVECGYTALVGQCTGGVPCNYGSCIKIGAYPVATGSQTLGASWAVFSGGLCQPEN
jgi:hypothetical protein